MKENEILVDIRRVRGELARECDYDLTEIFRRMRERTEKLRAEGAKVVSPVSRKERSLPTRCAKSLPRKDNATVSAFDKLEIMLKNDEKTSGRNRREMA